jgi:PAS domain S-box-containing protein
MSIPLPSNESQRLEVLRDYAILDTAPEIGFERLTKLAARLFNAPMALIALVDAERIWLKSCHGFEAEQMQRDVAICSYTILSDKVMVVPDTLLDARFATHPFVANEPHIRSYAGAPLISPEGHNLGTLTVLDTVPRTFSALELETLADLAAQVMDNLRLGRVAFSLREENRERRRAERELQTLTENAPDIITRYDRDLRHIFVNSAIERLVGIPASMFIGKTHREMGMPENVVKEWEGRMRHVLETGEAISAEFDFPDPNGRTLYFEARSIPEFAEDGSVVTVLSIARDITERYETERKLRESEERFQLFMRHSPVCAMIKDESGRFVYVNETTERVMNQSAVELMGKTVFDYFPEEAALEFHENDMAVVSSGQALEIVEEVTFANGKTRFWLTSKFPIMDQGGRRFVGVVALDISKRKRAEEALQESENQLRTVVEAIPQQVWTARPDGGIDYVNQPTLDYFGRSFEEMMEWGWLDLLHPDDLPHSIEQWTRSMNTGEPYEVEFRLLRSSDGTYRPHIGRALSVRDSEGNVTKWFGSNTDITDYKDALDSLHEREQTLQAILSSSPDAISFVGADGLIKWTSAATATFIHSDADDLPNQSMKDVLSAIAHPDDVEQAIGNIEELLAGRIEDSRLRLRVVSQQEGFTTMETNAHLLRDETGEISGMITIARDVTQQAQLEEHLQTAKQEAERANHAKSEFLSRMSHELRTPMNAILGFAQLLEMDELEEKQRVGVQQILKAGRHLLDLINEVLEISRIEAGSMSFLWSRCP